MLFSGIHYKGLEQCGFFMGIYCSVLEQLCVSKAEQGWGGLKSTPTEWDPVNGSAVITGLSSRESLLLFSSSSACGVRRLKWQERWCATGQTRDGSELALAWNT